MKTDLYNLFKLPEIEKPLVFLAPMAGFTDAAMRRITGQHGAQLTFTEMTSDMGLLHDSAKTWHLLECFEDEVPVVAHLYGSNPETLAEAARRVEERGGFAGIDLNAGCPVKKITKSGAGSALIRSPKLIGEIIAAMRKAVKLPLTIKTRLGGHPGDVTIFDILKAAEDGGADAITVHARFVSQGHAGEPDLRLLAKVKEQASIPVIGNGGIRSAWDARRMFTESGVDAIMVARCAIANPWIFEELRSGLVAVDPPEIYDPTRGRPRRDLDEIRTVLIAHLHAERELLERNRSLYECPDDALTIERTLSTSFRCHLFRYLHGLKGSSYLRSHLHSLDSMDAIMVAVDSCLERERIFREKRP